jgi:hypothetical protein
MSLHFIVLLPSSSTACFVQAYCAVDGNRKWDSLNEKLPKFKTRKQTQVSTYLSVFWVGVGLLGAQCIKNLFYECCRLDCIVLEREV